MFKREGNYDMWSIFQKFLKLFLAKQKRQLVGLFFLMVLGAFVEVLGVSLIVPFVSVVMQEDIIETNKIVGKICEIFHIHSSKVFLICCILLLILIFIFKDLYLLFQIFIQNKFIYDNRFRIQQKLMDMYLDCEYEYYLGVNSGEIIRVVQKDVEYSFLLFSRIMDFYMELIVSLTLIIAIFIINPFMTFLIGIILLLTMLIIAKVAKPMLNQQGKNLQEGYAQTNKWLLQMINGIKEIMVGDKQDFFRENFNLQGKRLIKAERWNNLLGNIPRLLIEISSIISMLIALLVAVLAGAELAGLIPVIAAFAMAAMKLMPSANRISTSINQIAYYEPSLDNLLESLHLVDTKEMYIKKEVKANKEKNNDKREACENTKRNNHYLSVQHKVELKCVSYHYPNINQLILQDANMIVPIGKSIGIVGVSGAGKTTVVDIMLGLLVPQSGEVLSDGFPVKKYQQEWLSHIGYIPQMIFMLDDTIRANVAFGIESDAINEENVWRALEEAQLKEFVENLPEGLDTVIGERGIRLSGGQRQRIGIARALYPDPELLFFDEATSALDHETETAIMESINQLHGKKTLVIIAHRLGTIAECDIVYRVENGKIIKER